MTAALFDAEKKNLILRPRISALLSQAVKHPLTIVCAGTGYGKTRAVFDFIAESSFLYTWLQLSECDNAGSRFWTKYTRLTAGWNKELAEQCRSLGFPDTADKRNQYVDLHKSCVAAVRHLLVLDDVHLVQHTSILCFLELLLRSAFKNTSAILICREMPAIRLSDLQLRGLIPNIDEKELRFTENELALYFAQLGLQADRKSQRDILLDTNGWPFLVNLVARSLKKAPGYAGYVRVAMKRNIFEMMEAEAFAGLSDRLRRFLVRLSLIDHLSGDLVRALAKDQPGLLSELKRENAYIRFDSGIHAYLIHHLFLDFLRTQTAMLTKEEKDSTIAMAADWCRENGFVTDALGYMEKAGDYPSIVSVLAAQPVQMPMDIALCAVGIFRNAPSGLAETLDFFAVMYVRLLVRLGRFEEAQAQMKQYEEWFLRLPPEDPFRNRTLGYIYYCWGNVRALMSTVDDTYDFDAYYKKMDECLTKVPTAPDQYADAPIGFWASLAGAAHAGAPLEYIAAATRSVRYISHSLGGAQAGTDVLCRGELLFYQEKVSAAEPIFIDVLQKAKENRQFELESKALFYVLRTALFIGNSEKAEQVLLKMKERREEESYTHRYINYDAAVGFYACALNEPEMIPTWLKETFSPYKHAYFVENIGNQIKARCHYLSGTYPPLIGYVESVKRRESILYGRVELMAMQACAYLHMKDTKAALHVLKEAYDAAVHNAILLPFTEMGKDMRTLAATALRARDCGIPAAWLEMVKRRAASFAKYRSHMIADRQKTKGDIKSVYLSAREREVLTDLYNGMTRAEIAVKQALSINTVNSAVNNIFSKLGAHSVADMVRIAAEEKLV